MNYCLKELSKYYALNKVETVVKKLTNNDCNVNLFYDDYNKIRKLTHLYITCSTSNQRYSKMLIQIAIFYKHGHFNWIGKAIQSMNQETLKFKYFGDKPRALNM